MYAFYCNADGIPLCVLGAGPRARLRFLLLRAGRLGEWRREMTDSVLYKGQKWFALLPPVLAGLAAAGAGGLVPPPDDDEEESPRRDVAPPKLFAILKVYVSRCPSVNRRNG